VYLLSFLQFYSRSDFLFNNDFKGDADDEHSSRDKSLDDQNNDESDARKENKDDHDNKDNAFGDEDFHDDNVKDREPEGEKKNGNYFITH